MTTKPLTELREEMRAAARGNKEPAQHQYHRGAETTEQRQRMTEPADCIWDRANPENCHAASQRSDGECWWSKCPAKDGVCPLHQMHEADDE